MTKRTGVVLLAAVWLAACGGDAGSSQAAPADEARKTAAAPPPAATPVPAPPRSAEGRTAAASEAIPTAADSAAAVREDVSPEWKMNERSMAPYAQCMAQARDMPENVRGRLEEACRQRPGAP